MHTTKASHFSPPQDPASPHAAVLVVDNRDSYTFNLADLIATVTGRQPTVVRADDITSLGILSRLRRGEFTHVVISPGPGTPSCEGDFGAARAVIDAAADARLPVLGVCLGHQGLALLAGEAIVRTDPHHGTLCTVSHSGTGIFAGIPQDFTAVRYHSLCVAEPAADSPVEVHARSEDGTIQAIRVVGTQRWGVQFHPESVLTEHGDKLIGNFLRASAPWRAVHHAVDIVLDTEATFRALTQAECPASSDAVWLDSAQGGRFSIMATTDGSLSRTLSFSLGDDPQGRDIFTALEEELNQRIDEESLEQLAGLPFTGGWIGYLGYECAALTLPTFHPRHTAEGADAYFLCPQAFIVYDHEAARAHAVAFTPAGTVPGEDKEARELVGRLVAALRGDSGKARGDHGDRADRGDRASLSSGSWRLDRTGYRERFARIKQALASGDSYEVCLTDTYETTSKASGIDLYSRLRAANPTPYSAYLRLGGREVLSASPERFLTVREDTVETKPIKGTLAREHDPRTLVTDPKTRAENLMIVDLLRNDLARVSVPGSVRVPKLMHVETYATVHQLVSTVTSRLRSDATLIDLVRATFPGGSMTGAPKERTCAIIDSLEAGPRGVYSGTIGYLGFDGQADLSIVIRTAVKDGERLSVGAGGAIVWDSNADAEYEEMQLKADSVLGSLR